MDPQARIKQLEDALHNITQFSTDEEAVLVASLALEGHTSQNFTPQKGTLPCPTPTLLNI